jgi:AsmA protein
MKIIIRIVIVLVVLFVGLFFAAQILVNRPFVREKVTKLLSEKLQRDVSLSGMGLSFFPSIGLNLKQFNISEKNKEESFASLENLKVNVELTPLFKKEVVVKEIILDQPRIKIEKDAKGNFNFSDMMQVASPPQKSPAPSTGKTSPAAKISIDSIRINEAQFSYKEVLPSGEGRSFQMSGLNLAVDHFSLDRPVSFRLDCSFGKRARLSAKGTAGPLSASSDQMEAVADIHLEGLDSQDLAAFIPKDALQGMGFENFTVKGNVNGSLAKGISGDLGISLKLLPTNKEVYFKGSFTAKQLEELILKELTLQLGSAAKLSLKGKVGPLNVSPDLMNIDMVLDIAGMASKELEAFLPKDALQGMGFENLNVQGGVKGNSGTEINGNINVSLKLLPANKDLKLNGSFAAKKLEEFLLKELKLNLGSSDILVNGKLKNLKAPQMELNVTSNLIDADDFLALSPPGEKPKKAEPEKPRVGPENPLNGNQVFQNAQGNFSAQFKKIKVQANEMTDLILKANLASGVLSIDQFSLNTFGGKVSGGGKVNLQKEKIGFDLRQEMQGVQLQKVSTAAIGEEKIQGVLTGNASFKGIGLSQNDLEKTLSGNAKVEVKEGKILGVDVKKQILAKMDHPLLMQFFPGLAKMREEIETTPDPEAEMVTRPQAVTGVVSQTNFKDFVVDVTISNGKANLQKMNVMTDDFTLRGSGEANFALQANLLANVIFSKKFTLSMTQGKDLSDLLPYENEGLLIPVRITGSLMKPMVLPDLATLLSALTQGKLKQQIGGLLGGSKEGGKESPLGQILGTGSKDQSAGSPLQQILGGSQSSGSKSPLDSVLGTKPAQGQQSSSNIAPLQQILGGSSSSSTPSSSSKNPLQQILGGSQSSSNQGSSSSKSPLDAIFGGQSDTSNQSGSQQKESDKSPFKIF